MAKLKQYIVLKRRGDSLTGKIFMSASAKNIRKRFPKNIIIAKNRKFVRG